MARRSAIAVVGAAALLFSAAVAARVNPGTASAVELQAPEPRGALRVAIVADRTTGFDSGLGVLEQAVAEINLLRPDLVLHIGDLVPGYTRDLSGWQSDVERVKSILSGLQAPFFPVAGNHDVITGTGSIDDRRGEAIYSEQFGPLYYSFDCGDVHFVCLYTEESLESQPRLSVRQKAWLNADLEATDAAHIFVLMHKPLWEYENTDWDAVHDLLAQHPVRAVFGGHFHHYYKSVERDGIQYYVLGVTGGRTFSPELAGGLEHYCLLDVDDDGYRLALVKPGAVLADDYVVAADFKAMEALRFLEEHETGVEAAFPSPESGPVSGEVAVAVTNPLDVDLPVIVRGLPQIGDWQFSPETRTVMVEAGARQTIFLGLASAQVQPEQLTVPVVEVQYTYTDSRGRTVPITLRRRVPLARECMLQRTSVAISPDGVADEPAWDRAATLPTAIYYVSPYEAGEKGPVFRLLAARGGLYFHARSGDASISGFRGPRMLSDAIFIGGLPPERAVEHGDLSDVPVIVIYPFGEGRRAEAGRAFWDPRAPAGTPVHGVHAVGRKLPHSQGWECEGFVPWDLLTGVPSPPRQLLFNIGAWDNDGELFTDLHSWAPAATAAHWGRLTVQE